MSNTEYQLPSMGETKKSNKPNRIIAVVVVLLITAFLGFIMIKMKPKEKKKNSIKPTPAVQVMQVQPIDFIVPITSDGLVLPKTNINVSAETTGKIIFVSDSFRNGGVFAKGDVLLKIDDVDYKLAITRAKANVASQQANLDLQQAKSDLAKSDWEKYGKKGKPNALNLNLPQVDSAKAALSGAVADLQLAKRNLEKTKVTAPFAGVIMSKMIGIGEFVNISTPLAQIASTEVAEIRMSLSDEQLFNSGLNKYDGTQTVAVRISSDEVKNIQWNGKVASIEAQRDSKTLFNTAVIEVNQPFSQQTMPLRFNTFVSISLDGKKLDQVYPIERRFITLENKVRVFSNQSQLLNQAVNVIYTDDNFYYVDSGIDSSTKIITTGLSQMKSGDKLKLAK